MTDDTRPSAAATLPTRVGHLGRDDHRYCGFGSLTELIGHESYAGTLSLAVGGRRLSPDEAAALDDLACALSCADPRIWPLKMIRVAASYGGIFLPHAAGQMVLENDVIGTWTIRLGAQGLLDLRAAIGDQADDDEVVTREVDRYLERHHRLVGYGVPFRETDERLVALRARVEATGRAALPHWRLQDAVARVMLRDRKLRPNIGAGAAALLLDMGFDATQAGLMTVFVNQNVFVANAYEGALQAPAALRSLPADAAAYAGPPPRRSPRAAG